MVRIGSFAALLVLAVWLVAAAPEHYPGVPTKRADILVSTFATPCGGMRLFRVDSRIGGVPAYRITKSGYAGPGHVFAARRIFTKEAGDPITLDLLPISVEGISGRVAQGAVRVLRFDPDLCPVRPERLLAAIAARLIPAYRRERAWYPIARLATPVASARGGGGPDGYDPNRLDGGSNGNFVGVTSGQGGEYAASRGFLHDGDAQIVDAVLHDESLSALIPAMARLTLESLAQPQGAAWSMVHHVTIDPQFPAAGDRPYEAPIWVTPNPAVDSMTAVTGWGRDVAHLENGGFVHWLLTGDPLAGLVVQRQAAFALASYYENYRGGFGGSRRVTVYGADISQERSAFNILSALWKSGVVARQSSGGMLWTSARTNAQVEGVIAHLDRFARRASPAAKITGSVFGGRDIEPYEMQGGAKVPLLQTSDFMAVQYGKEPLWLWAKAGNVAARGWLRGYAAQIATRIMLVGGTAGVDGTSGVRGSGFPLGPATGPLPYDDLGGWAAWVRALPVKDRASSTSFDGAAAHTAIQAEGLLLFAQDAGFDQTAALAAVAKARRVTRSIRYANLLMTKHLATPP